MKGNTHAIGGVIAAGAVLAACGHRVADAEAVLFIACSATGALIPDIDCPRAKISRSSFGAGMLSWWIRIFCKHRGFTHTVLFSVLITAIPWLINYMIAPVPEWVSCGLFTGTMSHLVLDSFNPGGIMWLYPFSKRRFHFASIRVGSWEEFLFAGICVVGIVLGYGLIAPTSEATMITMQQIVDFSDRIIKIVNRLLQLA